DRPQIVINGFAIPVAAYFQEKGSTPLILDEPAIFPLFGSDFWWAGFRFVFDIFGDEIRPAVNPDQFLARFADYLRVGQIFLANRFGPAARREQQQSEQEQPACLVPKRTTSHQWSLSRVMNETPQDSHSQIKPAGKIR